MLYVSCAFRCINAFPALRPTPGTAPRAKHMVPYTDRMELFLFPLTRRRRLDTSSADGWPGNLGLNSLWAETQKPYHDFHIFIRYRDLYSSCSIFRPALARRVVTGGLVSSEALSFSISSRPWSSIISSSCCFASLVFNFEHRGIPIRNTLPETCIFHLSRS